MRFDPYRRPPSPCYRLRRNFATLRRHLTNQPQRHRQARQLKKPRPGGNITGLSGQASDTTGKRIELLREIVPGLRRLAILADVGNPFTARDIDEVHGAARTLALEADVFEIRRAEDIAPAFEALQGRAQALYVSANPLFFVNRVRINTFALVARLPTMYTVREPVEAGV